MTPKDPPLILAIDTSCDETSVAITKGLQVWSNVVWSQAALHAKFGGVMPSLAQRMHEERIDWVIERALKQAGYGLTDMGAIAVTCGPGLAIALGVGISKAKKLAREWSVPLIPINHIEGHILSPLAISSTSHSPLLTLGEGITCPALGLVVSGGHTELVYINKIGEYKILAETQDDALGEALDKAARMLGLGYPGGAFLEKLAREGNTHTYPLPLPMAGRENLNKFSYSGLKTAMWRLTQEMQKSNKKMTKQMTCDLAASFQDMAFRHLIRVVKRTMTSPYPLLNLGEGFKVKDLLVGGGVVANVELRKRLRALGKELGMTVRFPYSKKLIGDNAAMIGVAAGYKFQRDEYLEGEEDEKADRKPRWRIDEIKSV